MGLLSALGRGGMRALESGQMFGRAAGAAEDGALGALKAQVASRLSQTNPAAAQAITQAQSVEEVNAILRQIAKPDEGFQMNAAITQNRTSPYGSGAW